MVNRSAKSITNRSTEGTENTLCISKVPLESTLNVVTICLSEWIVEQCNNEALRHASDVGIQKSYWPADAFALINYIVRN